MTVWLKNSVMFSYAFLELRHLRQFLQPSPSSLSISSLHSISRRILQSRPAQPSEHTQWYSPSSSAQVPCRLHALLHPATNTRRVTWVCVCVQGMSKAATRRARLFSSVNTNLLHVIPNTSTTVPSDSYRTFKIKSAIIFLSLLKLYMVSVYASY